jgi:hypothetical protein
MVQHKETRHHLRPYDWILILVKTSIHIATLICVFICASCALSPLDQDTPRQFSPIEDDPVVVPSRPIPAFFRMQGALNTRLAWPKFIDPPFPLSSCRIDTAREHPAVWINVSYGRDLRLFPPSQPNRLKISKIWIRVDSLSLLGDSARVELSGNPFIKQPGVAFEVHWFNGEGHVEEHLLVAGKQSREDTLWIEHAKLSLGPTGANANTLGGKLSCDIHVEEKRNSMVSYRYVANVAIEPKQ